MNIEEDIQHIEALYPTDCEYHETNQIGRKLLLKALENTNFNWRNLPDEILIEYARLCREYHDNEQTEE